MSSSVTGVRYDHGADRVVGKYHVALRRQREFQREVNSYERCSNNSMRLPRAFADDLSLL
jgi:hypothetical protein